MRRPQPGEDRATGLERFPSRKRTRASASAAPAYTLKAPRAVIGFVSPRTARSSRRTSGRRHAPGAPSTSPRSSSSRSAPTRFAATRATGHAGPRLCRWVCSDRIAGPPVAGFDRDLVADREAAARQRAGDDGAGALDREDAVDEQPRPGVGRGARRGARASRRARRAARRAPRPSPTRPARPAPRASAVPSSRSRTSSLARSPASRRRRGRAS